MLQMDIGGLNVQRALNNLIDALDYRRLTSEILEVLNKLSVVGVKRTKGIELLFLVGLGIPLQRRLDIRRDAQTQLDILPRR